MHRVLLLLLVALSMLLSGSIDAFSENTSGNVLTEQVSSIQVLPAGCEGCSGCEKSNSGFTLPFREFPFILVSLALFIIIVVKKNKLKIMFWVLGITLFMGLAFSLSQRKTYYTEVAKLNCSENQSVQVVGVSVETNAITADDEFEPLADDEFEPIAEPDEFQSVVAVSETTNSIVLTKGEIRNLSRTLIALMAAIAAGFAVRYAKGRSMRNVFLLSSLVYLGFYSGGCPCMVSSFQNFVLLLLGEPMQWLSLVWILGLLPITYFFGKVWCGWVCHLGAFQEFLFRPFNSTKMLNPSVQKILKVVRIVAFMVLIVQLLITRTNLFVKIDPFKVAFNLNSMNLVGYVLLAILLVSSLLIYRPFCRAFCPVGLVLGWVEKIPGASKLQIERGCKSCNQCVKKCNYQAIDCANGNIEIDHLECIRCGDCLDTCKFNSIKRV